MNVYLKMNSKNIESVKKGINERLFQALSDEEKMFLQKTLQIVHGMEHAINDLNQEKDKLSSILKEGNRLLEEKDELIKKAAAEIKKLRGSQEKSV